jgi:hypothetical protein
MTRSCRPISMWCKPACATGRYRLQCLSLQQLVSQLQARSSCTARVRAADFGCLDMGQLMCTWRVGRGHRLRTRGAGREIK